MDVNCLIKIVYFDVA